MPASVALERRVARFDVAQLHAMLAAGILAEGEPLELIDGVLVYKDRSEQGEDPMTIGKRHNLVVKLLARIDPELQAHGCHIQTQGPLSLPPSDEPEPDGAVLRGDPRTYADRLPSGPDCSSVLEVADASLAYDRTQKLAVYARAAIPQYIIVNLAELCIEVYEQVVPSEGRYARKAAVRNGEAFELRLPSGAHVRIDAARVLP